MSDIKVTVKGLVNLKQSLNSKASRLIPIARTQLVLAGEEFVQLIQKRWYSGRRGNDTGLNRISGDLHNLWSVTPHQIANEVSVVIEPGVDYALKHETGDKKRNLKKRSFVREDLNRGEGKAIFVRAVRRILKEAL